VFPFFLGEKRMPNINDWRWHFAEFRDWIASDARKALRGKKNGLSVSTQNNIIKTLNVFLTCLGTYNRIDPDSVKKCEAHKEDLESQRGIESIIQPEERDLLYRAMLEINAQAAEFFYVLWHTGMRFSELFGLPVTALKGGKITNKALHEGFKLHGINYDRRGYIYLESQPANDDCRREADKSLARKPLKGCQAIIVTRQRKMLQGAN
jgi:hypothetical protein